MMLHATFNKLDEARTWRADNGGWIFSRDGCEEFVWFSLTYTASKVMSHPAAYGNGILS